MHESMRVAANKATIMACAYICISWQRESGDTLTHAEYTTALAVFYKSSKGVGRQGSPLHHGRTASTSLCIIVLHSEGEVWLEILLHRHTRSWCKEYGALLCMHTQWSHLATVIDPNYNFVAGCEKALWQFCQAGCYPAGEILATVKSLRTFLRTD